MADDERRQRDDQKSLELPTLRSALGFGRKGRRRDRPDDARNEPTAAETSPVEPRDPVQPIPPVDPAPPIEPQDPAPPVRPAEPSRPERRSVAVLPAPSEESPSPTRRRLHLPHVPHRPRRPHLPGALVALVTGAVVGLALVGLTSAGLQLCSAVRGTPSCGNPGIIVLLAITVGLVFLGSLLLGQLGVDTHGSTSFLGVGLLIVVILLALLPVIDAWWMVIAIPVISMVCYLAAWWLTTTYVEPGDRPR